VFSLPVHNTLTRPCTSILSPPVFDLPCAFVRGKSLHSDILLGLLFTSARAVYTAVRTGRLQQAFGVFDITSRGTPIRTVILQAGLAIALIFLGGGFHSLVRIAIVT